MVIKEQVEHIAKLARLGLTAQEIEKMSKELSTILDYVEKLKEVDVTGVMPTSHSVEIENVMREDKKNEELLDAKRTPRRVAIKNEKLLELAPETKNGYLKVKSIL